MPKKNLSTTSLPAVVNPAAGMLRPMNGSNDLVKVDAVYHVKSLKPASEGPWNNEADKIAWTDPLSGYGCIISRSSKGGYLSGHVSVPCGHPLFERQIPSLDDHLIAVHGDLSYAAECRQSEPENTSICHVSRSGVSHDRRARTAAGLTGFENAAASHDDAWWFGFACNTGADLIPNGVPRRSRRADQPWDGVVEPTYKTEAFVYQQCVRLAVQLKAIEEGRDPRDADPGPTTGPSRFDRQGR